MNINIKNKQQTIINYLNIQQELFSCLDFYLDENSGTAKVCVQHGKENELFKVLHNFKEVEKRIDSELDNFSSVLSLKVEGAIISTRAKTVLHNYGIFTLGELINISGNKLQQFRGMGKHTYWDLVNDLYTHYKLIIKEY